MELSHSQFAEARADAASHGARPANATPSPVLPLVMAGGFAGALASWFIPIGLYETVVESIGLSEIFGAFAAPLGLKARLLIALAAAVTSALAVALSLGLFARRPAARPAPAPRRETPRAQSYEGEPDMARLAPDHDYQDWPPRPSSNGLFDRLREGLSRFPAPRRYDGDEGDVPLSDFSELKRLRPGGVERADTMRTPQPIAAHAELGEPLPPVEPVRVRRYREPEQRPAPQPLTVAEQDQASDRRDAWRPADNPFMPQPLADTTPLRAGHADTPRASAEDGRHVPQVPPPHDDFDDDEPESIEALTDRLARALHREAERGERAPVRDEDIARAEAGARRRAEADAARKAALGALAEAEEALEHAQRRAEEARRRLDSIDADAPLQDRAAPSVPGGERRSSGSNMDPALRDALRTLRRMTAKK